jgi:hypothetical protein
LIKNWKQLEIALFHSVYPRGSILRENAMIVEYISTRNERGYYSVYSSTKYGGIVYPRYFKYAKKWVVKSRKLVMNPETMREGAEYIKNHPHKEWIEKCFDLANIDYGRIDYGKSKNGHLNVWEINTNPLIGPLKRDFNRNIKPEWRIHTKAKEIFYNKFRTVVQQEVVLTENISVSKEVLRFEEEYLVIFRNSLSQKNFWNGSYYNYFPQQILSYKEKVLNRFFSKFHSR